MVVGNQLLLDRNTVAGTIKIYIPASVVASTGMKALYLVSKRLDYAHVIKGAAFVTACY